VDFDRYIYSKAYPTYQVTSKLFHFFFG